MSDTGLLANPECIACGCFEVRATQMETTKERNPPSTTAPPSGELQVTFEKREYFSSTPKGRKRKNDQRKSGDSQVAGQTGTAKQASRF